MAGVKILQPTVHGDKRGYLFESFRDDEFRAKVKDVSFDREYQYDIDPSRGHLYESDSEPIDYLLSVVSGEISVRVCNSLEECAEFTLSSSTHRQLFITCGDYERYYEEMYQKSNKS